MWFVLFKTLEGVPYYGDEPDVPEPLPDPRVEIYNFDIGKEYLGYFKQDFINPVDERLNALMDYTDVDYLNTEKCIKLEFWLKERLTRDLPEALNPIYEKLLEYASHAVELKTGVIVQL